MPLPPFIGEDLPLGVHTATLQEAVERLGVASIRRQLLALRLQRIYQIALSTGHLARFVIYGSFVTTKANPNDIDIFLLMEDAFDSSLLEGEATILFHHNTAQAQLGASVFWVRKLAALGGAQTMIEYWQMKRGGGQRGIVEIIQEDSVEV
jgi:hypothetical protein